MACRMLKHILAPCVLFALCCSQALAEQHSSRCLQQMAPAEGPLAEGITYVKTAQELYDAVKVWNVAAVHTFILCLFYARRKL
jgi:hypothetical protein